MSTCKRVGAIVTSVAVTGLVMVASAPTASADDVRPQITNSSSDLNPINEFSHDTGVAEVDARFAKVGDQLEVQEGAVAWLRDGTAVTGAQDRYVVTAADAGRSITVQTRGSDGNVLTSLPVPVGRTATTTNMELNRGRYTVGQHSTVTAKIRVSTADGSRPDGRIVLYVGYADALASKAGFGCKASVAAPASGEVSINLASLRRVSDQTSGRQCLGPGPYGGDSAYGVFDAIFARFVPSNPLDLAYSDSYDGFWGVLLVDTASIDPQMSLSVQKRHVKKGGSAVARVGLTLPVRGNATRGTIVLKVRGKVVARKAVNATGTGDRARRSVVTVRTRALKATGRRNLTATWTPVVLNDDVTDSRPDTARTAIRVVRR